MVYNVVLDLDNTLIYSEETGKFKYDKNIVKSSKYISHYLDGYFITYERPYLQLFLNWLMLQKYN
ncbi:HAD family hydrolase, partial [bacterium]|nr:HAD family hydrolase [bacterium]